MNPRAPRSPSSPSTPVAAFTAPWSQPDSIGYAAWQHVSQPGVLQHPERMGFVGAMDTAHDRSASFLDGLSTPTHGTARAVDDTRVFRRATAVRVARSVGAPSSRGAWRVDAGHTVVRGVPAGAVPAAVSHASETSIAASPAPAMDAVSMPHAHADVAGSSVLPGSAVAAREVSPSASVVARRRDEQLAVDTVVAKPAEPAEPAEPEFPLASDAAPTPTPTVWPAASGVERDVSAAFDAGASTVAPVDETASPNRADRRTSEASTLPGSMPVPMPIARGIDLTRSPHIDSHRTQPAGRRAVSRFAAPIVTARPDGNAPIPKQAAAGSTQHASGSMPVAPANPGPSMRVDLSRGSARQPSSNAAHGMADSTSEPSAPSIPHASNEVVGRAGHAANAGHAVDAGGPLDAERPRDVAQGGVGAVTTVDSQTAPAPTTPTTSTSVASRLAFAVDTASTEAAPSSRPSDIGHDPMPVVQRLAATPIAPTQVDAPAAIARRRTASPMPVPVPVPVPVPASSVPNADSPHASNDSYRLDAGIETAARSSNVATSTSNSTMPASPVANPSVSTRAAPEAGAARIGDADPARLARAFTPPRTPDAPSRPALVHRRQASIDLDTSDADGPTPALEPGSMSNASNVSIARHLADAGGATVNASQAAEVRSDSSMRRSDDRPNPTLRAHDQGTRSPVAIGPQHIDLSTIDRVPSADMFVEPDAFVTTVPTSTSAPQRTSDMTLSRAPSIRARRDISTRPAIDTGPEPVGASHSAASPGTSSIVARTASSGQRAADLATPGTAIVAREPAADRPSLQAPLARLARQGASGSASTSGLASHEPSDARIAMWTELPRNASGSASTSITPVWARAADIGPARVERHVSAGVDADPGDFTLARDTTRESTAGMSNRRTPRLAPMSYADDPAASVSIEAARELVHVQPQVPLSMALATASTASDTSVMRRGFAVSTRDPIESSTRILHRRVDRSIAAGQGTTGLHDATDEARSHEMAAALSMPLSTPVPMPLARSAAVSILALQRQAYHAASAAEHAEPTMPASIAQLIDGGLQRAPESTVPHPAAPSATPTAAPAVDMDELVERAWQAVMSRLSIEHERRGYARWA